MVTDEIRFLKRLEGMREVLGRRRNMSPKTGVGVHVGMCEGRLEVMPFLV